MALNLGLDNRRLLPPFLPVQRNQDGVFAALLRLGFPEGYFGFLPWLLRHEPPGPRSAARGDLVRRAGEMPSGQIVQALLRACAPNPPHADGGPNLRAIGRTLSAWGSAPAGEFSEFVRVQLWSQMARMASHLTTLLRRSGGQPAFWAADTEQVLSGWREYFTAPGFGLPADLIPLFGVEQALAAFQRLVRQFGELLQAWPEVVEAARRLKEKGVRPARPV
jgi:hypothetical protein